MAGGIREHHGEELAENHEINVTPFIDVILVLLIIFMVAAPLATVDVNVDLPASTAKPADRPEEPLYVTVSQDLSLNIGNDPVARENFSAALDAVTQGNRDRRIFLRADKAVDYGQFMEVMNLLRDAGYLKIALVGLESVPGAAPAAAAPPAAGTPGPEGAPAAAEPSAGQGPAGGQAGARP